MITAMSSEDYTVVSHSSTDTSKYSNGFELIAVNVPRTMTQRLQNTMNQLATRDLRDGQVVFSGNLEFRTSEAKGELRSAVLKEFFPEVNHDSARVMTLLPLGCSQEENVLAQYPKTSMSQV
mmetsp:Transcript_24780/g.36679  ORF Transcript_24780/g.36679 Transcript_24780/m.36679 type:complete len:122 (-) Transcript_24780:283-648(-)|eukprot:CAMPEP_0194210000 /NCGR_PEP_ID=MMETSP0156-20130528/7938_1 /TAXON_ID=33649 /ORGANISM="Thalassionema nitzschioides, Strain L26-B" /LENGTH=121 /DNA_ID=CAMNT_0038937277 /DNA_START=72 /DNA_END=437 /DNA_ORIENTATION=+